MLDKLKRLRTAWQKQLAKIYAWHTEHTMQRKLIISGSLVAIMALLLIGTQTAPKQSRFTNTPLNTQESFGQNSSATIAMTSRKYNAKKHFMVVKFQVQASGSQVINPRAIKLSASTLEKQDASYQVLPLANNNYVMVISNLKSGYQAIQIVAENKNPDLSQLPTADENFDGSSSSSSATESTTNSTQSKNKYKFIINESDKFVDNKMVKHTQKQYAIESLNESIKNLNKGIEKQQKAIKAYKAQIAADKVGIDQMQKDIQYKADASSNADTIRNAQADISTQQANIKQANKNIAKYQEQIKLYQKQIRDIKNGNYRFIASKSTGELK